MSKDECQPCRAGYYCATPGLQAPTAPCMQGENSTDHHCAKPNLNNFYNLSLSFFLSCPKGHYCLKGTGSAEQFPCPAGTYNPRELIDSQNSCLSCPSGHYCPDAGLEEPTGLCLAGFWCREGSHSPSPMDGPTVAVCPVGHYCPKGFYCLEGTGYDRRPCPAGTYSPDSGLSVLSECRECDGGHYYSLQNSTSVTGKCSEGCYCTHGNISPQPHTQSAAQSTITAEDRVRQTVSVRLVTRVRVAASSLPSVCLILISLCHPSLPVNLAHQVLTVWRVAPPHFPILQALSFLFSWSHRACPSLSDMWRYMSGKILLLLSSAPLPCPVSFILQDKEATSHNDCSPCPPSRYCIAPGPSQPSGFCSPGHYCISGTDTAAPQAAPSQQTCFCDLIPSSHLRKYDLCFLKHNIACSIHILGRIHGMAITHLYGEAVAEPLPCLPGHFCPTGTSQGTQFPCPPGTVQAQSGTASIDECLPCPAGHFCPFGTAAAVPCPVGTLGQVTRAQSEAACVPCPTGLYCNLEHHNHRVWGYFIESCLPCPAGHHCASEGLDAPTGHCAAGFYCPIDFSSTTPHAFLCPKGHYCPLGSPLALPCPTGQNHPNPGLDNCIPCRPGYYCEEAIIGDPQPCPPHSYPPAATMVPQPCHNGTYTPPEVGGLLEERECLPCPPGKFCKYVHRSHEGASSTMGTYDLVDL
ncbi:hypothetical protein cypCar_00002228 [Cyprinus carpio]|nr:hypothetical protein cypCar_00002228 [Cyprinus carpio]